MLKFRLLHSERAILLTREPEFFGSTVALAFDGIANATLALTFGGRKCFRSIKDGVCSFDGGILEGPMGRIELSVRLYDGTTSYKRYECEALEYAYSPSGELLLYPAPYDRDEAFARLAIAHEELSARLSELDERLAETEKKVNGLVGFVTE
ncbi:MAG: hypothetical protein IKA64_01910 [Clostridia bacterium]|nr:hypothetical protein [Clostridia bacterium]